MVLMVYFLIVSAQLAALLCISFWATMALPPSDRLPMQWGVNGRPTWSAPRRVALGFTPALFLLTFIVPTALLIPRQWDAKTVPMLGTVVLVGIVFIGCHALHVWLILRGGWARRD